MVDNCWYIFLVASAFLCSPFYLFYDQKFYSDVENKYIQIHYISILMKCQDYLKKI
jgi:hypothetical protein